MASRRPRANDGSLRRLLAGLLLTACSACALGDDAARSINGDRIEPRRVRLLLVGDSTMASYSKPPADRPTLAGWGQVFGVCFTDRVEVLNHARSGRSSKSFIREGSWATALDQRADYVFIQFGHNDMPGKGERSTDPNGDYRDYLRQYIDEARAAGMRPVLVTPVARRTFKEGRADSTLGLYVEGMQAVARATQTPLIDLHAASLALFDRLGDEGSADFSPSDTDRTHFSRKGAIEIAGLVAAAIPDAVPELKPLLRQETSGDVHHEISRALDRAELALRFNGKSPEEFGLWRQTFRERLNGLLGDYSPPANWTVKELSRDQLDDHTRIDCLLEGEGVPSVPVYLLIPRDLPAKGPVPAVLCIHGHGPFGNDAVVGRTDLEGVAENIERYQYDYGREFVRRGYVVAAPCLVPFGRRIDRALYGKIDPCAATFIQMQAFGGLPITSNLRDLKWTLDFVQSRPEVARERIGCTGLSLGGRMAMLAAALDERIKVVAVSGALNLLQERALHRHLCGSQIIPGLLNFGDYAEIGALIAPRPSVWETGSHDPLIVAPWDDAFRSRLRRAYDSLGASEQLKFDTFAGGHEWNGRIAYRLFDEVLKR